MPVENGVAPVGPSGTVMPVLAPAGGSVGMPSLGSVLDLRGALPLLPAPVPGLIGPAMNFVGNAPEAAAVQAEAAAAQIAPAPATAQQGRHADKTPALPGKPTPGSLALAISLNRHSAASTLENGQSAALKRGDASPSNPLTQPEKAAGLGRSFFDQSNEKAQATLAPESGSDRPTAIVAATILQGGAFGPNYAGKTRLAARDAGAVFGAGHGPSRAALAYAPEGETLHDAVAAMPGAGAVAAGGPSVKFFGAVAPNGDMSASAGSAVVPFPSAPRPLALDLSRSGLIVRVRSALNGVIAPAQSDISVARLAARGSSTALLERGAMLEAFSVSGDYAARTTVDVVARPAAAGVLRAARSVPFAPLSESAPAPLWWAWFALPLFVAAIRQIL